MAPIITKPLDWLILAIDRFVSVVQKRAAAIRNRRILAQLASCGKDVHVHGRLRLTAPHRVVLGNNVHIAEDAYIRAEGGLTIGDNTHISRNLVLYTVNHQYKDGARLPYDERFEMKPVVIGRNVWIGMNVCVAPGTTIGDGAVIGMGTVVSGDVPPLSVIGSQNWRILGWRDQEHYQRLDRDGCYGGVAGRPLTEGQDR